MTDQHAARDPELIASDGAGRQASLPRIEAAAGTTPHAGRSCSRARNGRGVIARWREIQAHFVDGPRSAVQQADALVADLMQRLARTFAAERDRFESRWTSSDDLSPEDPPDWGTSSAFCSAVPGPRPCAPWITR